MRYTQSAFEIECAVAVLGDTRLRSDCKQRKHNGTNQVFLGGGRGRHRSGLFDGYKGTDLLFLFGIVFKAILTKFKQKAEAKPVS